ncbi:uncharacterized protein RSE6_01117 [Rhynchosporium secalis]|uniref:Uncharacterized protein n=1 Tax=Rhynchosporium secalis TaxID=38038 RepID=A0A1E1LX10_RHYSE|nr:uncharacterized protein RSE6_01117 [Rhynchosporium secalis]
MFNESQRIQPGAASIYCHRLYQNEEQEKNPLATARPETTPGADAQASSKEAETSTIVSKAQKLLGELAEMKNRDPAATVKSLISEEELDKMYKGVKGLIFNHSMTKIVTKNLRKVKSAMTVKTVKNSAPDKSSVHEMLAGWEKLLRDFEQKLEGSDDTPILDEAEELAQAAEPISPLGQIMKDAVPLVPTVDLQSNDVMKVIPMAGTDPAVSRAMIVGPILSTEDVEMEGSMIESEIERGIDSTSLHEQVEACVVDTGSPNAQDSHVTLKDSADPSPLTRKERHASQASTPICIYDITANAQLEVFR